MEEGFWERKGVKTAFVWIALDVIILILFLIEGFNPDFIKKNLIFILIAVVNIDRIVIPLANLPEPPMVFTFLIGVIPAGVLIAYYVSLFEAEQEAQDLLGVVLLIALLLWNAANIGWGIWAKKKSA
ncbi:MAG: hypothetical protein IJ945_06470 [Oscillospiraceae bacterium]|nr:hypothetical protein [Oscillospiraceae bacterium]